MVLSIYQENIHIVRWLYKEFYEFPEGKGKGPTQYFCLKISMDEKGLVGYHPWRHKELDMTEWF